MGDLEEAEEVSNLWEAAYREGYSHAESGRESLYVSAPREASEVEQKQHAQYPIEKVILDIRMLFNRKNAQYATDQDQFANFHESAPVANHLMTPFLYCMTLAAKQDDAFWKAINRSEGERENIYERLIDGAVYRIIALALFGNPAEQKPK